MVYVRELTIDDANYNIATSFTGAVSHPYISFGIILDHFATWSAQTVQMVVFGTVLDHFATWAAQTVQTVAFGIILDHFVTWAAQPFVMTSE